MLRRVALLAGVVSLSVISPAVADIAFTQVVILKNDPTSSNGYKYQYSSFDDGAKDCWKRKGSSTLCHRDVASGTLVATPRTYRLKERNRARDYYLLDLTVRVTGRKGDKGAGYLSAELVSNKAVKGATYSEGKSTVDGCKTYPLDIAAGWGSLSVGTTVGSFGVNCYDTSIKRSAISLGQRYHVTNVGAVKHVTFQRFVTVKAGAKPRFTWKLTWPTDRCFWSRQSDAQGSFDAWMCVNGSDSRSRSIGTGG